MKKLHKLAIFDFCGTVVLPQTGDLFVSYVLNKEKKYLEFLTSLILRNKIYQFIKRKIFRYKTNDKFRILQLIQGIEKQKIDEYSILFAYFLEKYKIESVSKYLDKFLDDKHYDVYIISAGYSCYIEEMFTSSVKIIANDFCYVDGRFTGNIDSKDCIENEKVNKLSNYISIDSIDFDSTHVFSDSLSDLPIFRLGKHNHYVIGKNIKNLNQNNLEKAN